MFFYILLVFILLCILNKYFMFWCKSKVCLVGKTAIITGGNAGLGYQAALALASRGCKVIIADVDDSSASREKIIKETNNPNIVSKKLNLGSLKSVREFAQDIIKTEARLDILINNAGIGTLRLDYTEDGLQRTMQVNYFGHFLLTHLLVDLLKKTGKARIIFTSSVAAYLCSSSFTLENLNPPPTYKPTFWTGGVYSNSKLCDAFAAIGFAEKLKGTGVTANAFHPGGVRSHIFLKAFREEGNFFVALVGLSTLPFGKSTEEGAQTLIHLACANEIENRPGEFFIEGRSAPIPPKLNNKQFCKEMWNKSVELVILQPHEIL